jgi:hypothetical protein
VNPTDPDYPRRLKEEKLAKAREAMARRRREMPEHIKQLKMESAERIKERDPEAYSARRSAIQKASIERQRERDPEAYAQRIRDYSTAFRRRHPDKAKEDNRRYKAEDPERYLMMRRRSDWRKKGIRVPEDLGEFVAWYNTVWLPQRECQLCGDAFRPCPKADYETKCIDHCHASGTVRWICCRGCNLRLRFIDERRKLLHNELLGGF